MKEVPLPEVRRGPDKWPRGRMRPMGWSGGVSTKGKRKPRQEEDEDYREFPQKKHKLYGRKQRPKTQPNPKSQARRIRKEPPVYAAGSLEEQWYLEIVDKGSVSCPTCQAVGRKTIEGLKKHMENCKQLLKLQSSAWWLKTNATQPSQKPPEPSWTLNFG
nr:zinc finger protein 512-like [Saimiri boliviensis boliviensis]